jgi:parallel beta-helix repeat protein
VNGAASGRLVISNNHITNLTVGPVFLAAHRYQTDGINIKHQNSAGYTIAANRIHNTGEGIDIFGSSGTVVNNIVSDSHIFGIKLVHGATGNTVSGNKITRSGLAGIVVSGSDKATRGTENNMILDNTITDIDPGGMWAARATACIRLSDYPGMIHKARNNVFSGNVLDPGKNGKWAIDIARKSGESNVFSNNHIVRNGTRGAVNNRMEPETKPSM